MFVKVQNGLVSSVVIAGYQNPNHVPNGSIPLAPYVLICYLCLTALLRVCHGIYAVLLVRPVCALQHKKLQVKPAFGYFYEKRLDWQMFYVDYFMHFSGSLLSSAYRNP